MLNRSIIKYYFLPPYLPEPKLIEEYNSLFKFDLTSKNENLFKT